jgi:hypothetical protein
MARLIQLFTPVLALVALALFSVQMVNADDAATSQPSANSGSISVTVLDPDGNAAAKAALQLYPLTKSDDADAKPKRGKSLAKGKADADGKYTFSNLASGDYLVSASLKKINAKGTATASITDSAASASVTINLATATTAPAEKQ